MFSKTFVGSGFRLCILFHFVDEFYKINSCRAVLDASAAASAEINVVSLLEVVKLMVDSVLEPMKALFSKDMTPSNLCE